MQNLKRFTNCQKTFLFYFKTMNKKSNKVIVAEDEYLTCKYCGGKAVIEGT